MMILPKQSDDEILIDDLEERSTEGTKGIAKLLRGVALVILLSSSITFLFQGWSDWSSVQRVSAFIGFISFLASTGLFLVSRFKDDKGARVSIGVATAIIPAAFCQIGGIIYSLAYPGVSVSALFRYTAASFPEALLLTGIATAVLTPIAIFGFSALARADRWALLGLYALGNALLLVPTREPLLMGLLAISFTALNVAIDYLRFRNARDLQTGEAIVARTILYTPALLLIGRNVAVYGMTPFLMSGAAGIIAALLFQYVPGFVKSDEAKSTIQDLSLPFVLVAWSSFAIGILREFPFIWDDFSIPLCTLPLAVTLFAMSFARAGGGLYYRHGAATLAACSVALNVFIVPGFVSSFICIALSTLSMTAGYEMKERGLFQAGCFGLGVGLLYYLRYAAQIYHGLGPWLSLAILGVVVLVLSSLFERQAPALKASLARIRQSFRAWS